MLTAKMAQCFLSSRARAVPFTGLDVDPGTEVPPHGPSHAPSVGRMADRL